MLLIRVLRKYRKIMSTNQMIKAAGLGVLMIIGGLLETFSVSLVLPFIDAIMNPEETMNKWYAIEACKLLRIDSFSGFLIAMALFLAFIYILKNVYLLLEYSLQYKFVYGNMFRMQKRLLKGFIHRPYDYFLNVNSGEIIRLLNNDTPSTYEAMMVVLNLFTETVVSIMLVTAIFILAPGVTIAVSFVLIVLLVAIITIIKPSLKACGVQDQGAVSGMNKWLLQSIQGIKEVKITKGESFFQDNFNNYGHKHIVSLRKSRLLYLLPRFMIEGICMASMFLAVAYLIMQGGDFQNIVPIISAIAVAAVRLLPSINRISAALGTISFSEPMIDKLVEHADNSAISDSEEVDNRLESGNGKVAFEHEIVFNNIKYKYPNTDKYVLDDVAITIKKGESIGIIGASGSGKTTLMDVALGLLKPDVGQVMVDGIDVSKNISDWYSSIGYIPQTIFMLDGSIKDNVEFGLHSVKDDEVVNALKEASLSEFVAELPQGIYTEIGERGVRLSGGQRQRIGIARVLYRNPDVLFFDEATSALDNETEASIMESVHGLHGKKTMIIIAHRLSTIEKCDHVYKVENGSVSMIR